MLSVLHKGMCHESTNYQFAPKYSIQCLLSYRPRLMQTLGSPAIMQILGCLLSYISWSQVLYCCHIPHYTDLVKNTFFGRATKVMAFVNAQRAKSHVIKAICLSEIQATPRSREKTPTEYQRIQAKLIITSICKNE